MLSAQEPQPDVGQFWRTLLGCLEVVRGSWDLKSNRQGPDVKPCLVAKSTVGRPEVPGNIGPVGEGSKAQGLPTSFSGQRSAFSERQEM